MDSNDSPIAFATGGGANSLTPVEVEGSNGVGPHEQGPSNGQVANGQVDGSSGATKTKKYFKGWVRGGDPGETPPPPPKSKSTFLIVMLIVVLSCFGMLFVYHTLPEFEEYEKPFIKFPRNIEDAKALGDVLYRYKDRYYYSVLGGVFFTYIFLQTFAIPGSIFLSILSGFLFNFPVAMLLICFCSSTGATFCYFISYLVGRKAMMKYFPEQVEGWAATVNRHKDNLLNYIIFLRVTPFLPNWFINVASPLIDVPVFPFYVGTFIGVAPPSFVAIQAGRTLQQMTSSSAVVSWTSLIILIVLGFLSLLPIAFKDYFKAKFE